MTLDQKNLTAADFEIGEVICHPDLPKDQFEIFAVAQETTACVIHAIEFDDENPLPEFARQAQEDLEKAYVFMNHELVREIRGQLFRIVFYVPTNAPKKKVFGVNRVTHIVPPQFKPGDRLALSVVH